MWPFTERRRSERYKIDWDATLCCFFPELEERLQVKVIGISRHGALLLLQRMQVGPYHLLVGNHTDDLELNIDLPEGMIRSKIAIRWYNLNNGDRSFTVGVEFFNMADESKSLLKKKIKSL